MYKLKDKNNHRENLLTNKNRVISITIKKDRLVVLIIYK